MIFGKNILTALALIVAALSLFFACSRNEGTILTEGSSDSGSPGATGTRTFSTRAILPGDSTCPKGGLGFDTCWDTNDDGVCSSEVDSNFSSQSICDSARQNVCTSTETAGAICPAGGLKLQEFRDLNEDGVCGVEEPVVGLPSYICNSPNTISLINGAVDGVIDVADATSNLDVVENPFAMFDEESYAVVLASATSCASLVESDYTHSSIPTAGDPAFVSGSYYKVCARYQIGVETKLLLSGAFHRI